MSTTLQQLPTGTYAADPIHSTIGFGVKYNGLATFRSTFDAFDAKFEDGVLTGTAQAESITVDEPNFKGHLLSGEFFDVEQTPTITFRSTDVRVADDGTAEVDGQLTIRGISKPVTATGTFAAGADPFGNDRVAFELEAKVDRREFGLNWQNQLPTGADALAWDVTLVVDLQLVKQA
jgi:polyisoprenoid-binding protein YceI